MRWRGKLALAGGLLVLAGVGTWQALPTLIRREIHKRHPEVAFTSLDYTWTTVTLHEVTIDKGWIVAHVNKATIQRKTETVHLEGGTLDVDLDKRLSRGEVTLHANAESKVTAEGLTVSVKGAGLTAAAEGFALEGNLGEEREPFATATHATVKYRGLEVGLSEVRVKRDLTLAYVKGVWFPDGVKVKGQEFNPALEGVTIDIPNREVYFEMATVGVFFGPGRTARITAGSSDRGAAVGVAKVGEDSVYVNVDQLDVMHPWLAGTKMVRFRGVSFTAKADEPFDIGVNGATIHVDPVAKSLSGDESCETWARVMPEEFHVGPLKDVSFTKGKLQFSLGLTPQPFLKLNGQCTSTCNHPSITDLRKRFTYQAYDDKSEPIQRTVGPLVPGWVPLAGVHENVLVAVLNLEDYGFRSHHGFIPAAFQNSFAIDVQAGKFERGGSTITMQTAKNLWLSREKTIARKVEELFLSQVLESCLSKDDILETYLNIVEFGPNVYGLHQGAKHYFKTGPGELEPAQAFYLAWILPRPRKAPPPDAGTLERMNKLMKTLAAQGRVPNSMLLDVQPADTMGWDSP